jgi:3',5'-cyclic AMP phosphodiesterase CpdA
MSRILHLSDLHLGKPLERQLLDSQKGSLASADIRAERHVLIETLDRLDAEGVLGGVQAIVISGDLTNAAEPAGFDEFAGLVELLTRHIGPEQIVVVPGNHDVPREHGPADPERYTEFLRVTRKLGLATPLLDGLDFSADGHLEGEYRAHEHLVGGEDFLIVPINSSHYCWGTEPLPESVIDSFLSAVDPAEVEEATEEIRRHDIPRVSNAQMAAIEQLLGAQTGGASSRERSTRIAVLHHQLLPVSASEEFKAFESLTNLGAIREFLVSLGIQVVLHGHKHTGALYWDFVADQQRLGSPPARVLVVAGPGRFRPGELTARVLDLSPRKHAPEVRIEDVFAAERRGGSPRRYVADRARLWDDPAAAAAAQALVIRGTTPAEVYERVQSHFDSVAQRQAERYLICEIADPRNAEKAPDDYPMSGDPGEIQAWMTDLVDWWQLHDPQLSHGVAFNHGERIYKRWGDQVDAASKLLSAASGDPSTTRAAILLLDPATESSPQLGEFPSFVSVQFQLVAAGGTWRLDCTGTFRKQEMRYWWPINVAELARVQAAVASKTTINRQKPKLGVLRTVTALAIVERQLPTVAVPAIDRAMDQRPEDLWRLAYSLIDPEKAGDAAELRALWDRYMRDLRPDVGGEPPAMSHRGLRRVLDMVHVIAPERSSNAAAALNELVEFYGFFSDPESADAENAQAGARRRLEALDGALDAMLGTQAPAGRENPE